MNKSRFFEVVKSCAKKPEGISIYDKNVCLLIPGSIWEVLVSCKSKENAAKECHKFNRWLAEALETIKPSETSWRPEPQEVGTVKRFEAEIPTGGLVDRCFMLEPGNYTAKLKSVDFEDGNVTLATEVNGCVLKIPVRTYPLEEVKRVTKKQKSPEKMYIRAAMKALKLYDCFDSAKNPHWSNMSKKQKKQWARNFGIEVLEANIHEMAHDLSVDAGFYGLKNNFSQSIFKGRAKQQIIDELDASEVEDMIEENLNCLW